MPTDHATVSLTNVWVPNSAVLGPIHNGLAVAQAFVHENRIRQAASSLGAAAFCVRESGKSLRTDSRLEMFSNCTPKIQSRTPTHALPSANPYHIIKQSNSHSSNYIHKSACYVS